jgi:molybdopterin/thiamine biosynthesis adenylyltransferase
VNKKRTKKVTAVLPFFVPTVGGVLGPLPGVIGTLQAMEVLKVLGNVGTPLVNRCEPTKKE